MRAAARHVLPDDRHALRLRVARRGADLTGLDALSASQREQLMRAPRPRVALPVFRESASRRLPLAGNVRAVDRSDRPIYVVWELTLKCDLACRHCGSRAGAPRSDELALDEALDVVR